MFKHTSMNRLLQCIPNVVLFHAENILRSLCEIAEDNGLVKGLGLCKACNHALKATQVGICDDLLVEIDPVHPSSVQRSVYINMRILRKFRRKACEVGLNMAGVTITRLHDGLRDQTEAGRVRTVRDSGKPLSDQTLHLT